MRAKLDCLRHGKTLTLLADDYLWAYARITKKEMVIIVVNAGDGPGQAKIQLSDLGIPSLSKWTPQLGLANGPVMKNGVAQVMLPPRTAEVYLVSGTI